MSTEPWLLGPIEGVSPFLAPMLRSFEQVREDLAKHIAALTDAQVWARPFGLAPVGFQLRHIAGSVDRLMTYAMGGALDAAQMTALREEMTPGSSREALLAQVDKALSKAEEQIRAIDPTRLGETREVGRKRLPTTLIGLLIHIAEHTQRHTGQAISAAKLATASGAYCKSTLL
jgi:hypothetical protein